MAYPELAAKDVSLNFCIDHDRARAPPWDGSGEQPKTEASSIKTSWVGWAGEQSIGTFLILSHPGQWNQWTWKLLCPLYSALKPFCVSLFLWLYNISFHFAFAVWIWLLFPGFHLCQPLQTLCGLINFTKLHQLFVCLGTWVSPFSVFLAKTAQLSPLKVKPV